jgi:hypothetical protein
VLALSGPGSLRPKAKRRARWTDLVCVSCRMVSRHKTSRRE